MKHSMNDKLVHSEISEKISNRFFSKKTLLIYGAIAIAVVTYQYGYEVALLWVAVLYAMLMTIFNVVDIYWLIKSKVSNEKSHLSKYSTIRLLLTTSLILLAFWFIPFKLRIMAASFAIIILIVLLLLEIFYFSSTRNSDMS